MQVIAFACAWIRGKWERRSDAFHLSSRAFSWVGRSSEKLLYDTWNVSPVEFTCQQIGRKTRAGSTTRHFLDEKCLPAVKIVQTVNEMVKGEWCMYLCRRLYFRHQKGTRKSSTTNVDATSGKYVNEIWVNDGACSFGRKLARYWKIKAIGSSISWLQFASVIVRISFLYLDVTSLNCFDKWDWIANTLQRIEDLHIL